MQKIISQINDIFTKLDTRIKTLEKQVKELNDKKSSKKS